MKESSGSPRVAEYLEGKGVSRSDANRLRFRPIGRNRPMYPAGVSYLGGVSKKWRPKVLH